MTDNEIIKCAENCTSDSPSYGICLYNDDRLTSSECMGELMKDLFDLTNRQQAESEKLEIELKAMRGAANSYKAEVERLQKENERFADIGKMYSEIRAEAIKEFAERLKEMKLNKQVLRLPLLDLDVDNLVKEMTEVQK